MSGSTENLLRNSHLSVSKESIDGDVDGAYPSQKKTGQERKTGGMENRGFIDDHREFGASNSSEIYETPSYHKRATSFQQKPMASPTKEPRRHSSPDHSAHFHQGRTRSRQGGGRHRLSGNSEEDLRRKACLNSMKRHQSANPLPISQEDEMLYRPAMTAQDTERQSNIDEKGKIPKFEGHKLQGSSKHDTENQQKPLHRQDDDKIQKEVQNMQRTIIALEKSQLEQYKRRLTLALSERAKLTGELKLLSQNLTQRSLESDHRSRESIHLGLSRERNASPMASSRLSYSLGDLSIPEMYGDCDISVDYENKLRLPPLPTSTQSGKTKMDIPELDLASLNSSIERISSDHTVKDVEKFDDGKAEAKEHYEDTKPRHEGPEDNMDQERKENLKKMVDDIWQDNLRGDVLAEDRQDSASENHRISENNGQGDSDLNNNELKNKEKRLTVEDFLADDDLKDQQNKKDKTQRQDEMNVLLGYEDMNGDTSRARTPELYEPVECLLGQESYPQVARIQERQPRTPINYSEGLLRHKDYEKSGKQDDLEEYFTASTLPVTSKESIQDQRVRDKRDTDFNREQTSNENHQTFMTRFRRNERRFDYMTPPGTRPTNAAASSGINYNEYSGEKGNEWTFEGQIPPSNISDKLQYYREKLANRVEEETSRDLVDAYANEKDPEKRREIQQQAASEAAMLRREASALLWEAMNLERICDPNGRVRHVYLPH